MKRQSTKKHKTTLEQWSFRWSTLGIGLYAESPMRDIPNEYIAKTLSWYESLPDKSPAIKVFKHMYLKIIRERCIRKHLENYTINKTLYFNHPRKIGRRKCKRK